MAILDVKQSPEFGFSISKQDTTITKGSSIVLGTDMVVFGGSGEYAYHWWPATTLSDSTSIHPMASPTDTTLYLLTITDKFGCSISLNYTVNVVSLTGIIDLASSKQSIQAIVFPNPNNGSFRIHITGSPAKKIFVEVVENNGKVFKKQIIRNFQGDHSESFQLSLVSSVYYVRISAGTEILTRKFIIQ